jgi:hypothetical protein
MKQTATPQWLTKSFSIQCRLDGALSQTNNRGDANILLHTCRDATQIHTQSELSTVQACRQESPDTTGVQGHHTCSSIAVQTLFNIRTATSSTYACRDVITLPHLHTCIRRCNPTTPAPSDHRLLMPGF